MPQIWLACCLKCQSVIVGGPALAAPFGNTFIVIEGMCPSCILNAPFEGEQE